MMIASVMPAVDCRKLVDLARASRLRSAPDIQISRPRTPDEAIACRAGVHRLRLGRVGGTIHPPFAVCGDQSPTREDRAQLGLAGKLCATTGCAPSRIWTAAAPGFASSAGRIVAVGEAI